MAPFLDDSINGDVRGHGHVRGHVLEARDGHRDRSSLHDSPARTPCGYPTHDDDHYRVSTSDFCAIHSYGASNRGRASRHRPSSFQSYRDRQYVILLTATELFRLHLQPMAQSPSGLLQESMI